MAQQVAGAAAAPPPSSASSVAEVIVTATKRSSSVQEVPAAITAVSSQQIQQRGIHSTEDLQFAVPSLQVGNIATQGYTDITIRGVGLNTGSQQTPAVAVYVDGVYQPHSTLGGLQEVDLNQIEVLRGPQGTLYGRNANGGAVDFISDAPTHAFGGYVMGAAESYGEYRGQGMINLPLGDNWALRGVVNYDDRQQGFIKNIVPGGQSLDRGTDISGRLRLRGDLSSTLSVDLEYAGDHSYGPFGYLTLHGQPTTAVPPSAVIAMAPWQTSVTGPSGSNHSYNLGSLTLAWTSPIGLFKSITAYQADTSYLLIDDSGYNAVGLAGAQPISNTFRFVADTFTQEVNWSDKLGPVDAIAGFFFMQDNNRQDEFFAFPNGEPGPFGVLSAPGSSIDVATPKYNTTSEAGYGDVTWNITSQLRLTGGVRYSAEQQKVVGVDTLSGPVLALFGLPDPLVSSCGNVEADFSSVTPRGVLQYDLDRDNNVYGSYSEGYKAGGVNTSNCTQFKPETIDAYELGYKGRFLDRRLTVGLSGFYYDYDNLQLSQVLQTSSNTVNAKSARIEGLEFESTFAPDAHLAFNASATWLDATYTNFISPDFLNPAVGNAPCPAGVPAGQGCQNVSGDYLDNAPKFQANAGASYRTDEMSWGRLVGRVDVAYRSTTYFREFNLPLDSQGAYTLVNLGLTWTHPNDKYSVRLFANNAGATPYISTMGSSVALGSRFISWGNPRQYGIEAKASF